jgi:hypothetical protein
LGSLAYTVCNYSEIIQCVNSLFPLQDYIENNIFLICIIFVAYANIIHYSLFSQLKIHLGMSFFRINNAELWIGKFIISRVRIFSRFDSFSVAICLSSKGDSKDIICLNGCTVALLEAKYPMGCNETNSFQNEKSEMLRI